MKGYAASVHLEHEHDDEDEPLVADFGVSFSVESFAALGSMQARPRFRPRLRMNRVLSIRRSC